MTAETKHILIAEDNPDLSTIYQAKLVAEGYEVTAVTDGRAALDELDRGLPDLILLDIVMPGMDGLEFLRQIRKAKTPFTVPIIVMTNLGQDEDRETCEELGAKKFLIKTEMSIDDLAREVKEALGA